MPDILRTGLSGLLAFQRALATTSHNVANVGTEGYSRQVTDLATKTPQGYGSGFVRNGVDVVSVRRIFDQFAVQNLRTATANAGQSDTVANFAGQIDDIIGDPTAGISSSLQAYFNAWQDVANNPSSAASRQVLISQAQTLASRFSDASTRLDAVGLAVSVNAQQAAGLDLTGQLGSDIFSVAGPRTLPRSANTGSGSAAASISDISALTGDEYDLRYNGSAYSLVRMSDGSSVALTGAGTVANPFVAEGASIVVAGAPAAGDQFRIQPTRTGASSLASVLSDPRGIAAAGPIRTSAALANAGNASISQGDVLDASNVNLLATASIQFLSATTYSVNGGPAVAYTSGGNIDVNGWRVQISGTPVTGDSFTIQKNTGGAGDNRNALLAAGLQNANVLAGGTTSISGAFSVLVGAVGSEAQQANVSRDAQATLASQAKETVSSISGVNLDEEAADLVRWQHAYQAAAQTIAVAGTLFDTLIAAVRR